MNGCLLIFSTVIMRKYECSGRINDFLCIDWIDGIMQWSFKRPVKYQLFDSCSVGPPGCSLHDVLKK